MACLTYLELTKEWYQGSFTIYRFTISTETDIDKDLTLQLKHETEVQILTNLLYKHGISICGVIEE